jgi:hypothetical protein
MAGNSSLNRAKTNIDDEFYTQLTDIEKELRHYRKHFRDKVVLCNCDDPFESNFFKYFALNFNRLGLKKLMATCYDGSPIMGTLFDAFEEKENPKTAYKAVVTAVYDADGDGDVDMLDVAELFRQGENSIEKLEGNGDFRSAECLELLNEADIVVTNPPFSMFIEYVLTLIAHSKKFIVIGSQNKFTNKDIFPLFKNNEIWLGNNNPAPKQFYVPGQSVEKKNVKKSEDGRFVASFGNICWFTNLDIKKRHEELILVKRYKAEDYPKYDNYDAIECQKRADIPCDYGGVIGVTPGFLFDYNPEQFEIVGVVSAPKNKGSLNMGKDYRSFIGYKQNGKPTGRTGSTFGKCAVIEQDDGIHDYYEKDGRRVQQVSPRIFIRNRNPEQPKEE